MSAEKLMELWKSAISGFTPNREQFALWLMMHDDETVRLAISKTARKYINSGMTMESEYLVRYASSVMNNRSKSEAKEMTQ